MSVAPQAVDPQSASLALTLLQSKAGNRWARAVEEMKTNRLRVAGDLPEFIVTNKSGTAYKVKLDPHGTGSSGLVESLHRGWIAQPTSCATR